MNKPVITQEMIRAYDEYTHLTLDRRGFMAKLTKLAGSAAAASVIAPMLSANPARAAIVAADDQRVKAEDITFPGPDGEVKGYLAMPADATGKLPAVVVVHENRGLNPHIEDVARRMAIEGIVALAVDFLSPLGGTPENEDTARELFAKLEAPKAVQIGISAVEFLKNDSRTNGNVGAVGFCWGGGIVNQIAVNDPDLKVGVAYYGRQPDAADVAKIRAKMLLHYGGLDERVNEGIPAFEEALKANNVEYQLYVYDGANHAFNNDTSEARYDKAAADLAWSRTVALLKEGLS
jgi:carboxymethylenebutenolidase